MTRILIVFVVIIVTCMQTGLQADNDASRDTRLAWFSDAKLGIFIHWGIYAVDGIANKIMDLLPDNTAYVTKAKKWMQLLLGIPGNEDYDFCATYARACFLTRDYKTAVQTQEKAIQLAIQSELDKKDIEEYKKQLTLYKNSAGLK